MEQDIRLVHHSANREHSLPSGTLGAMRKCIENRARFIEVDITPTADGHWALLHNAELDDQSTGTGRVDAHTTDQLAELRMTKNGVPTEEPVSFLRDALELIAASESPLELQLDLKADSPLSWSRLEGLVKTCKPVLDRLRVTSIADWALRRLDSICPDLLLGFDPLAYLDMPNGEKRNIPPFRVGAYGYHDEHPLASRVWGSRRHYLTTRAEILYDQVPSGTAWYIRATTLEQTLKDGFDWVGFLHQRDVIVDAWTLDSTNSHSLELAHQMARVGIDRITTNTAPSLARALEHKAHCLL